MMKKIINIFLITIFILITGLLLISFIPQKMIYKNTVNSFKYYYNQKKIGYLNNTFLKEDYYKIDYKADMKSLSMAYEIDEKDKLQSLVKMNYLAQIEGNLEDFSTYLDSDDAVILNYGRYWQGQTIFLRLLLVFFNVKIIYYIGIGLFFLIFILLSIMLIKKDKILGISFIVGNVLINFFIIPYCFEYIYSFLISYISCIVLLQMINKKSQNVLFLFLVNGILVAFFDFLTCETITLSLPLFIYIFLKHKDISYKDILKIISLWIIGYLGMFIIKWVIMYILYGKEFIINTLYYAEKRVYFTNENMLLLCVTNIGKIIKQLFGFNKFRYGITLFTAISFYIIYNMLFKYKDEKYRKLFLVCIIPFLRFILLSAHAYVHYYFIYRAILPFLMFIVIFICSVKLNLKDVE